MVNIEDALLDTIAAALVEPGYLVLQQALPPQLLTQLLEHFSQCEFRPAGIGRQADFQMQASVRSDHIHWLAVSAGEEQRAIRDFLGWMDAVRIGINRRLYLGLSDYESHFASYEAGAFYKKHRDAFSGQARPGQAERVVSTVLYLNEAWQQGDGGELVLYAEDESGVLATIAPEFGRVVIFLSEKFPHEVLPARRERKSIAGWFRVNR